MANPLIQRLMPADLEAVLQLYAEEAPGVPPDHLDPRSAEELAGYLDGSTGRAFGVRDGRRIDAVGLLRLPEATAFAGQPPFPYVPPADWPQLSAFAESTLVRSAARGRGHQRALIKARTVAAEAAGRRWLCAAAHPENRTSWVNLLKSGFVLVGFRQEPQLRLGFLRPLGGASLALRPETQRRIELADRDGHAGALAEGLVGVALGSDGTLLYRLPVRPYALPGVATAAA
jgi:hypothetical protein